MIAAAVICRQRRGNGDWVTGVPDLFGIIQSFFTGIINAIQGIFNAVAKIFGFPAPGCLVVRCTTVFCLALGTPSASTGRRWKVTIAASATLSMETCCPTRSAPAPAMGTSLSAITNGVSPIPHRCRSSTACQSIAMITRHHHYRLDGAGGAVASFRSR